MTVKFGVQFIQQVFTLSSSLPRQVFIFDDVQRRKTDNGMLGLTVSISSSTVPGPRLYHRIIIFSFIGDDRRAVKEDIRWSASARLSGDDGFILVDNKHVTAEALFDNDMTSGTEAIAGTLEATCP